MQTNINGDKYKKLYFRKKPTDEYVMYKKAFVNGVQTYSAGNTVTYVIDSGVMTTEEVEQGATCLNPSVIPTKTGWIFAGWCEDNSKADSDILLDERVMGDDPVTLYALYQKDITLSYAGNGSTGGSTESETKTAYFNAYDIYNYPEFTLKSCGFEKTDYIFTKWDLGKAGSTIKPENDITANATWMVSLYTFVYTGAVEPFIAPIAGTYQLKVWGAQGGDCAGYDWGGDATVYARSGGLGGYSYGNITLAENQTIYVCVGGQGGNVVVNNDDATAGGYNGGGSSKKEQAGVQCSGGGGCTHIGTFNNILATHGSTTGLYIVAGGGGGCAASYDAINNANGGTGGGETGGNTYRPTDNDITGSYGATQSGSGTNGKQGGIGYGGDTSQTHAGGGGGGLYGGSGGDDYCGGGGGSGYIGGVTNGSTTNGQQSGNGKAEIVLLSIA